MKIVITAQNKGDQELLGAKRVEYLRVQDAFVAVRYMDGEQKKIHTNSFGCLAWLTGRLYAGLKYLEGMYVAGVVQMAGNVNSQEEDENLKKE